MKKWVPYINAYSCDGFFIDYLKEKCEFMMAFDGRPFRDLFR